MSDNDVKTGKSADPHKGEPAVNRRDAFRGLAAAAAATAAAGVASPAAAAEDMTWMREVKNPYGGGPNTGITLPPYYRPTPSVANANTFFPGMEDLGADEMRISFIGSSPVPPTRDQAGTAIMVELGNGEALLLRPRPRMFPQHRGPAGPDADDQRHLHHPSARRSLWRAALHLRLLALVRALEAAAGHRPLGPHAQGWHQGHDRGHEGDDPLAHGELQLFPDRGRLRGRRQRVRLQGRQRHLL